MAAGRGRRVFPEKFSLSPLRTATMPFGLPIVVTRTLLRQLENVRVIAGLYIPIDYDYEYDYQREADRRT